MARIIAGRFEAQQAADRAIADLVSLGAQRADVATFYLNPPGQHAQYPIGGDAHHDEGTKESGKKAVSIAALGGVTGLALGTATGAALGEAGFAAAGAIAGAGIGGYVGALAGGLTGTRSGNPAQASIEEPVERAPGVIVALKIDAQTGEDDAVRVLRNNGAVEIERAEGDLRDSQWTDFDPRSKPDLIGPAAADGPRGPAGPRA